jgi:hypothetical protein
MIRDDGLTRWFQLAGEDNLVVTLDWSTGTAFPALDYLELYSVEDWGEIRGWVFLIRSWVGLPYVLRTLFSGYILPEVMATCLSALALAKLQNLLFGSLLHPPSPASRHRLPPIRVVLPFLRRLHITFFDEQTFGVLQLPQFISHTEGLKALEQLKQMWYFTNGLLVSHFLTKMGSGSRNVRDELFSWRIRLGVLADP